MTDFGLAKTNIKDQEFATSICGSPAYISPEMLELTGACASSDIYGIGAVLYEMLQGEPPYFDIDRKKMFENIKNGKL